MYYAIGVSVSSLHRESTNSLIMSIIIICTTCAIFSLLQGNRQNGTITQIFQQIPVSNQTAIAYLQVIS